MLKQWLRNWLGIQELSDSLAIHKSHVAKLVGAARQSQPKPENHDDMWPEQEQPAIRKGYAKVR